MSSFSIDDSVPMPSRRNRYPFDQMVTGQSFEIVGDVEARKVRNAAYQYAKKISTQSEKLVAEGKPALDEVRFALRKVGERATGELAADGAALTVKIYRLWRE